MILPADGERAGGAVFGAAKRSHAVAPLHHLRRLEIKLRGARGIDIDGGRQIFVGDLGKARGGASMLDRIGRDGKHRLADVLDQAVGEHWIVLEYRADVVLAGDIVRREHRNHAGCVANER